MQTRGLRAATALRGLWLNPGPVRTSIKPLLLHMLERTHPDPVLHEAVLEELQRRTKFKDVIFRALGVQERSVDQEGDCPLWIVTLDKAMQHPWHEALLTPGGDCPIGFVVNTYDHGKIVLVHEVFYELPQEQQALIRRYAALTMHGSNHSKILATLNQDTAQNGHALIALRDARRRVQILDPSVLFSPDGGLRVELGSLSQTTKNLLREGITGEYLFILPKHLFESRTNYADVEFLVYLNFFVRYGTRTRIVGTARQRDVLEHLLRLTIFGLFDPHAHEQPSFETLHSLYNVPDRETYALFRMLYEKYGVRQNCCATGAILDLDAYIDFVVLDDTARPLRVTSSQQGITPPQAAPELYSVQIAPLPHGSFEVSIAQTDGRVATKTLEVHRPVKGQKKHPGRPLSCYSLRSRSTALRGNAAGDKSRLRSLWGPHLLCDLGQWSGHSGGSVPRRPGISGAYWSHSS